MAKQDKYGLDPVKYQIYRHRLYNILEEGRLTIRCVTGSAVVAEGGETLCSFYMSDGTPVLTALKPRLPPTTCAPGSFLP